MTELPLALGIVLAVRWWLNGNRVPACLVVGFLPSVRPEGFFFGVIFGVMVLSSTVFKRRDVREFARAAILLVCLSVGLLCWVVMSRIFTGDALLVLHVWSWPLGSYAAYGSGSIFHYAIYWPVYCGLPLFVLFVMGIKPSLRRSMWLPLMIWFTIIGVHSILYWRAWFASCGLIRIMACSSPFTALICLFGWNNIANRIGRESLRFAGAVFSVLATVWVLVTYCLTREHLHCLPMRRCVEYVQQQHLLDNKPWFFAGDQVATAMLQGPNLLEDRQMDTPCDPQHIAKNLAALPVGAIGIWDTEQAPTWHGHTIDELSSHGFTILYETHTGLYSIYSLFNAKPSLDMRYVVLRKDGPFVSK